MEWRSVFWVTLGILLTTSVIYIIWGSAEVQLFNDVEALRAHKAEQKRIKEEKKEKKKAEEEKKKAEAEKKKAESDKKK